MNSPPIRAAAFKASHGVNTHINYNDGGYANLSNIVSYLSYLGIDRIRDGLNTPGQFGGPGIDAYETVARTGVKFTLMVGGGGHLTTTGGVPTNPSLDQRVGYIERLARSVPGSVVAVEGTNEINNQPISYNGKGSSGQGADELEAAVAMQRDLYAMVHASPHLKGIPVYHFTGEDAGSIPTGPDPAKTPGLADYNTRHPYPNFGEPPAHWVSRAKALGNLSSRDGPVVYTETGYSSNGGTAGAVNEDVQAKYTLDLLLDAAREGVASVYLYELMDAYAPGSPQGNAGYGLFDHRGNPKPVAFAIRNMNAILSDTGASANSFTPTVLPYSVSGRSPTGYDLEMAKSDGSHVIALWDEQPIWDASRGVQLKPVTHRQTVTLGDGTQRYTVAQYDPLQGDAPIATFRDVGRVTLSVSDRPIFLLVRPARATLPVPVQPPASPTGQEPASTPPSAPAPDRLVLRSSEDAYKSDAQFVVAVGGQELGGARTVTASHAAGPSQEFVFEGDFGEGVHTAPSRSSTTPTAGGRTSTAPCMSRRFRSTGAPSATARCSTGTGPSASWSGRGHRPVPRRMRACGATRLGPSAAPLRPRRRTWPGAAPRR